MLASQRQPSMPATKLAIKGGVSLEVNYTTFDIEEDNTVIRIEQIRVLNTNTNLIDGDIVTIDGVEYTLSAPQIGNVFKTFQIQRNA